MSAENQVLTSQDISYAWTNASKTEFVLHYHRTGIVRGFVGPGRKSFSIEIDGKGTLTLSRMVDAKKKAVLLWMEGHRVPFPGRKPVVKSSSNTGEQNSLHLPWFNAEAFPHLHNCGENAPPKTRKPGLAQSISEINPEALCAEYKRLIECAPRRSAYFGKHTGVPSGSRKSNRYEEHLAMALWNIRGSWPPPENGLFRLLDYQFPLQATSADRGIGEIDLLGLTENGRLMIIELKADQRQVSNNETPLAALLQGLRYSAILQANQDRIAKEVEIRCNISVVTEKPPVVQILAPEVWWRNWMQGASNRNRPTGNWELALAGLARELEKRCGISIEWAALKVERKHLRFGGDGHPPHLRCMPRFRYISLTLPKA